MKKNLKKMFRTIVFHSCVLIKGILKMLYGTLAAIMMAISVHGFTRVPDAGGYVAVFRFLLYTGYSLVALINIYLMGARAVKEAK